MDENCVEPTEIQEGDLMAYVDGVAEEAVVQHIRRCPACTRQVKALVGIGATFASNLYRRSCPQSDQLVAYNQGDLRDNEKLVVAQHLRQCPHCARELAGLAREGRVGLCERLRAAIEVLEATLVIPSPRGVVVRDAPEARVEQWVYRIGEIEITLNQRAVWAQQGHWDLSGQVHVGGRVPETISGARVELYRGEGLIAIAELDPRGHFAFASVESSAYDCSLLWEGRDIRVKGVRVG